MRIFARIIQSYNASSAIVHTLKDLSSSLYSNSVKKNLSMIPWNDRCLNYCYITVECVIIMPDKKEKLGIFRFSP